MLARPHIWRQNCLIKSFLKLYSRAAKWKTDIKLRFSGYSLLFFYILQLTVLQYIARSPVFQDLTATAGVEIILVKLA